MALERGKLSNVVQVALTEPRRGLLLVHPVRKFILNQSFVMHLELVETVKQLRSG